MSTSDWERLTAAAEAVLKPRRISKWIEVGGVAAAILTDRDNIHTGVCIDSACSLGMCAERSAAARMLTCGENRIVKIVCLNRNGFLPPCGACREFLMELDPGNSGMKILLPGNRIAELQELLPEWWGKNCKMAAVRNGFSVRAALPKDAPALAELHMRAWEDAYRNILPEEAIRKVNAGRMCQWPELLRDPSQHHFVAQCEDEIAGFIGIRPWHDSGEYGAGEIGGLYVAAKYWNRGIGSALLAQGIRELLSRNMRPIRLWVLENNLRARRFYENNRFRYDGTRKEVVIGTRQIELCYRFEEAY